MKFARHWTILFFFMEGIWKITYAADFHTLELDYLARKLHPAECKKLLEKMYLKNLSSSLKQEKGNSQFQNTSEYCKIKLEEWNRTIPENENELARINLEVGLRCLHRPDLANYITRNRRFVDILSNLTHPQIYKRESKYLVRRASLIGSEKRKKVNNKKSLISLGTSHAAVKTHVSSLPTPTIERHPQQLKKDFIVTSNFKSEPAEVRRHDFGSFRSEKRPHATVDNSFRTLWIAFGIFILFIMAMISVAALISAYKNRFHLSGKSVKESKTCDDRCPLTDHFQRQSDIEYGWTTNSTDYMGTKLGKESLVISSRSPSFICMREKKRARKIKRQRDKQQQTTRLEKPHKNKEGRGKKKKKVSKERGRNEFSLRERIANILRKDKPNCHCCKCTLNEDYGGNNQVCPDQHCRERRIVNLTDLCSSTSEKGSQKLIKSSKCRERKESIRGTDSKDHRRTSSESSPGERKESRFKETFARIRERSPRWSLDNSHLIEPCTRLTCEGKRSPRDRNSVDFDDAFQNNYQFQKLTKAKQ
uniref:Uncharacterized protein n=1 Tax=Fopius arisanus TaxID=64838 RepID=A0A0C9R7H9_9HYME